VSCKGITLGLKVQVESEIAPWPIYATAAGTNVGAGRRLGDV